MSMKNIAVVGAGLSGVSCATRLLRQSNCCVKVFEKNLDVGGRMTTLRGIWNEEEPYQCDHGAQYFTARSHAFRSQVNEWREAGAASVWGAHPLVLKGSSWENSTSVDLDRWCGTPVMQSPVYHLLRQSSGRIEVQSECAVDEISRTCGGLWRLHSNLKGWQEECYDAVILALPAPQASHLVSPHSSTLRGICEHVVMKGAWAVTVWFPPSQPLQVPFDCAFIHDSPLSWVSRDNSKPGRQEEQHGDTEKVIGKGTETETGGVARGEVWLLHATANWSEQHSDLPPAEAARALISAFGALHQSPPPQQWRAHHWEYATTHPNLELHSVWDDGAKLGLCGDWLSGGKVEGAWTSGVHLAESMKDFI